MTLSAVIAMFVIAMVALPVVALAAMLSNALSTAGFGDVLPDERLLAAIAGAGAGAGDRPPAEHRLWT